MEATGKIGLDTSEFEAGAERVSRASSKMAGESEEGARRVGASLRGLERAGMEGGERASGGIRDIGRALAATRSEAGAVRFGLLEVARAAGLGTAGIIAMGAGAEVAQKVASSIGEAAIKAREMGEEVARVFSGTGGTGTGSSSGLRRQIDEASAAIDKLTPGKESIIDIGARAAQNAYRAATGNPSVEEETDQRIAALDALRASNSLELAKRRREEVDFSIRALRVGEENLRVEKEQLATRERIRAIVDDKAVAGQAAAQMIDAERALGAARVKAAEEEVQRVSDVYTLRRKIAEIRSPGITTGKLGFDPKDLQEFAKVKSVATANAEFSQALSDLQTAKDAGHDTAAASANATEKQIALSEALRTVREERDTLNQQVTIQGLQLTNQVTAAKNAGALLGLQKQITAASNAGKDAEAAKYQAMLDQVKAAQKLQAFLHPEEGARDRAGKRATEQAQRAYDRSGGLLNVHRDMSGNIEGGIDPETGKYRRATDAERAGAAAREKTGPYTGESRVREAFENGTSFDETFDHAAHQQAGVGHFSQKAIDNYRNRPVRDPMRFDHHPAKADGRDGERSLLRRSMREPDHGGARDSRHFYMERRRNVAEENRPNAPQKQEQPDHGIPQLVASQAKLTASIDKIAAKLGVA